MRTLDRLLIKKIEISNCGGFTGEPHDYRVIK